MADLNQVILLGRVARAPELKEVHKKGNVEDGESGEKGSCKVCRLVVAVNNFRSDSTDYFDVTIWNRTAENCAKYLEVGRTVLIEGYLQKQQWEKDGKKQYKTAIIAKNVQFLPDGKKKE